MKVRCFGCGWTPATPGLVFACPGRDELPEVDHVLRYSLDDTADSASARPGGAMDAIDVIDRESCHPFVRYRRLLVVHQLAASDRAFVSAVERLDDAVQAVDGRGFVVTPYAASAELSRAVGCRVLVKDETGNVSGSHKARHLFGLALAIELTGLPSATPLAIASCGNAALAAAVIAAAIRRPLDVFVPVWADESVVERLDALGARIQRCPRRDDDPPGDPCHHRFREAVLAGAIPFGCQGPDNGLTIDGGTTLGLELADPELGAPTGRVFVQVGGGALATSVGRGMAALGAVPALFAVQTQGCAPLARAWAHAGDRPLHELAAHRPTFMWPWEDEPRSSASGILDDETYDWVAVVELMRSSGGRPVVVPEELVARANELGRRATGIDVDATGKAGLAGLLALADAGEVAPDETVTVLFTGARRATNRR